MKTILIALIILFATGACFAAPFLTCAKYTAATEGVFELVLDTGTVIQTTPRVITGGIDIWYDLKDVTRGAHVVKARFCNQWGDCSEWSAPFAFQRPETPPISGLTLGR